MNVSDATISDLLAEVRRRTGLGIGGRAAKKIRKEVRKMQGELASDLKAWIRGKTLGERIWIATRIILGRDW